jgi:hypothetical protein
MIRTDEKLNRTQPVHLVTLILLSVGALLVTAFGSIPESYWARMLRLYGRMNLPVDAILQSKVTSCGPAAIVMAFNYANPETQLSEKEVIEFAVEQGYYTERKFPFTSPENMARIAEHYGDGTVSTGTVEEADEALALLTDALTGGDPVIIDILTRLDDPKSGAHFVVVTGLAIDTKNPNAVRIFYNDPLTGRNRSGDWHGGEGIWNAWRNNRDPGGSGWWMVIASP